MKIFRLHIGILGRTQESGLRRLVKQDRSVNGVARGLAATFLLGLTTIFPVLFTDAVAASPEGWATHCVGRFLVDLPRDASIKATFTSAGARISTAAGVDVAGFKASVRARESELQSAKRSDGGSMLVERYALTPSHEVLVSWSSPAGRRVYRYEEFQHFADPGVLFRFESKGNATASSMEQARAGQKRFGAAVRTRGSGEIPRDAGFCIERGFVAGKQLNREEMDLGIVVAGMPLTRIDLAGFVTRNPEPPLSRRIRSGAGLQVIRQDRHEIGGMAGEEVHVVEGRGPLARHEFMWEFSGTPDSLSAPFMKLTMSLDPGAVGEGGDFPDIAAATRFWDALLASLRQRPGAI